MKKDKEKMLKDREQMQKDKEEMQKCIEELENENLDFKLELLAEDKELKAPKAKPTAHGKGKPVCIICHVKCSNKEELKKQIQSKHKKKMETTCPHCYLECKRLNMHIDDKHYDCKSIINKEKCPKCNMKFGTPDELEDHIAAGHPTDRKRKHQSSKGDSSKKDESKLAADAMKADSTNKDSSKQNPKMNSNITPKDEQGKSEKENLEKEKNTEDKSKESSDKNVLEQRRNLCKSCQCSFPTKKLLHKHITLLHPDETAHLMDDVDVEQPKSFKPKEKKNIQ